MISLLPVLVLVGSALSMPAPTTTYDWSPALAEFYSVVDRHIQQARAAPNFPQAPACDLSQASMPVAPTPLPAPNLGDVLGHVAIGRGVQVYTPQVDVKLHILTRPQNYTCANSSATPVSIGAVASLYNASCVAASYPDLLSLLPNLALNYPQPAAGASMLPSNLDLSGHHFFANPTTPMFDMTANPATNLGVVTAKKVANSTAPAGSPLGVNGVGNGAVPWLYLQSTNATTGRVQTVYRLNTAGGSPPKTCASSPATFSVQYAAEYWFYES
jgi:hypothetical protein